MEEPNMHAQDNRDHIRFNKALFELRGLRSQLHYAADYCKSSFLSAQDDKRVVLDNTKEYICRAVVTFIDHLGNVSSNINFKLAIENSVSETELRINSLHQRLATCEQYTYKLALKQLRRNPHLLSYHPRYMSKPIHDIPKQSKDTRYLDDPTANDVPVFMFTVGEKPSLAKKITTDHTNLTKDDEANSIRVLPVRDGLSSLSKAPNPAFLFQATSKGGPSRLTRKKLHGRDMLSLFRRAKRPT